MIFKGVTAAILALLLFRYRLALMFGTVIGIFCFTCNANRDLILVLGRLGLSISYSTILATLHTLAADSDLRLRAWGAATQTTEPAFLLVFDNVNKMQRAWQQTVGHKDEVKSGTAATLIRLEDVPPGAMKAKPLLENMRKKERGNLTVQKLLDDIDWYDGIPAFAGPPINCYSSPICEAHTHVTKSPRTKLLEGLQQYFEAGGPLEDCSFDQLSSFAITVYQRYMCISAYEDALGHSPRDPKVYGLPSSSDADVLHGELYFQAHGFVPNAESDLKSSAQNIALTGKPSKRPKKAAAAPIRNFSQGDQSLATTVNFIRTTFWYIEMCAATAEGDIGRVFAIIKVILLVASLSGLLLIAQL